MVFCILESIPQPFLYPTYFLFLMNLDNHFDDQVQSQISKVRQYTIVQRVGAGAFGIVYKITNADGDSLALKVLAMPEQGKLKVMVPIFGRETAVELDSLQVQKI